MWSEVTSCKLQIDNHDFRLYLIIGIGGGVLFRVGVCLC